MLTTGAAPFPRANFLQCAGVLGDDHPRRAQAVDGRADDSAGVAGAFAAGIEAGDAGALPAFRLADDPHRRAAARFGTGERRVAEEPAAEPAVHLGKPVHERFHHELGQEQAQVDPLPATAIARG